MHARAYAYAYVCARVGACARAYMRVCMRVQFAYICVSINLSALLYVSFITYSDARKADLVFSLG